MRLSLITQFVVLILIGCGVYSVANKYQIVEKKVNRFEYQSEQERENIRVLQAEWAFLTNPVRMEKIAREHFQLQAVDGTQLVMASAIPMRETMDAQEAEVNIAHNKANPAPVAQQQQEVVQQAAVERNYEAPPVSAALPVAQALPAMEAIPVSNVVGDVQ